MLLLIECTVELALNHSGMLRWQPQVFAALRYYHHGRDSRVPQHDSACIRWDPEVGYRLRPPGCTIVDREFTVHYAVNRQGLRDDEASLHDPAIVVVGDSYAMGWGVAQEDSFAEVMSRDLGVRVLNAGISSYDTARELALADRLGLRSHRALVIQYCGNDDGPNRTYVDEGRLDVHSEEDFTADLLWSESMRRRYFGKHLVTIATRLFTGLSERGGSTLEAPSSAYYFLETLLRHEASFAGKAVVVVAEGLSRVRFIEEARALITDPRYATLATTVTFSDPALDPQRDFFPLDGHLNERGHALEAAGIERELTRRGVRFDR